MNFKWMDIYKSSELMSITLESFRVTSFHDDVLVVRVDVQSLSKSEPLLRFRLSDVFRIKFSCSMKADSFLRS